MLVAMVALPHFRKSSDANSGKCSRSRGWRERRGRRHSARVEEKTDGGPTLLVVEDNDEDVFILQRAFRRDQVTCKLQVAQDGQQAIDYLSGTGAFADRSRFPVPSLVLLDLKLPYVNGFEFLAWVTQQPAWKDLRIIILTSSDEERDRAQAEQYGIRSYFVKPPTRELTTLLASLLQPTATAK